MTKTINELNLREACILAAREVIAEKGVEAWSMRDVARKLEISHQAPYRHFPNRDHLLAEIMKRCFMDFAAFLDERAKSNTEDELKGMGLAYITYAATKPLEYRLMFGTPWPDPAVHTEVIKYAVHAFDLLRNHLIKKHGHTASAKKKADLEAMFIWSSLHGLATIEQSNVMKHLTLSNGVQSETQSFVMGMIGKALGSKQNCN